MESDALQNIQLAWDWCRDHIDHNSILRLQPGKPQYKGKADGALYSWQFYLRRSIYNPRFFREIGMLGYESLLYHGETTYQICACEDAGVGVGLSIQAEAYRRGKELNLFTFKKERKAYGMLNHCEGIVLEGTPTVIVDDLAGSQETMLRAQEFLTENGILIAKNYFAIVNKVGGLTRPHKVYLDNNLVYLYSLSDFNLSHLQYTQKYGREPEILEQSSL